MYYNIMLTLAIALFSVTSLVSTQTPPAQETEITPASEVVAAAPVKPTLRETIKKLNHFSIPYQEDNWNSWSYYEFLSNTITRETNPIPAERRRCAFNITTSTTHAASSIVQESTTWQDLCMFAGKKPGDTYVGEMLCNAKTEMGRTQFYGLLAASSNDTAEIARRQAIVKTLLANPDLRGKLNKLLADCALVENLLLSFFTQQDNLLRVLNDNYFFNDFILKHINNNSAAVWGKYGWDLMNQINGIVSDGDYIKALATFIMAVCIPQVANPNERAQIENHAGNQLQNNKLRALLWNYGPTTARVILAAISIYFSATYLNRTINNQVDNWMFEEIVHFKLVHVAAIFTAMQESLSLLKQEPALLELLPELGALPQLFATTNESNGQLRHFLDLIADDTFAKDSSGTFANRGKITIAYTSLHTLKPTLLASLQALSLLDAYNGIAETLEQHPEKFCFAQLEQADTPHLLLEDFINPLIPTNKAVANTIELGNNAASRNCIITGPNAGGKSTLIKAIGINVLMAQSLGIAAARRCVLTPFNFVATYLNITDDINSGNSLFKAEVLRTQELIMALGALPPGQHGLLIFDEVFNGTTPKEGSAAAFAVAEHLGTLRNGITIVATHFEKLTTLTDLPDCSYKNYKVTVKINDDGSLNYPFKLKPGISSQHIALDILRSEGYTGAIVTRTAQLLGQA
jgi:DNA mismatch repair protein MutS